MPQNARKASRVLSHLPPQRRLPGRLSRLLAVAEGRKASLPAFRDQETHHPTIVRLTFAAAASLGLAGTPGPATAAEFPINACQADRTNFSTQAFDDFATRGMMWKRACDPEGDGLRGLVTGNVVRPGRVARGARSYFVMRAPAGTRFARLTWSGHAQRRDCRYALQVWASRPDGPPVPIKNVRANRGCPNYPQGQAAGWPRARTYDVTGATSIVQRIICVGRTGAPRCSSRGRNYIRTFKAQATVVDVSPPGVSIVQDNAFTRGEWVEGRQAVTYGALDNVGVKVARAVVGGLPREEDPRTCDYAKQVPCENGSGSIVIDTSPLGEGTQALAVEARDAADNSGVSAAVTVRVDNTAPGTVPVVVEGGEAWRNSNDFDLAWTNSDEGDRAPITAAHYRVCRLDGSGCADFSRPGPAISQVADLAVPAPGEWQVRLWRQDAASNQEPANASVPVTLRFDPEPPQLGFEQPQPSDPTLVSVLVTDKVSGLAGGQIEISRTGSGNWQTLATQQVGSRLVARIDDAVLPPGEYLLRATARDQASNQNSTATLLDGRPMALTLPLRTVTTMRAGVVTKRTIRPTSGRHGKRRKRRRQVTALEPQAHVNFARQLTIGGRLEHRDGQPLVDAEVQVWSRSVTEPEQLAGVVRTDAEGRYTYPLRADASRILRFAYEGSPQTLPAWQEVTVHVGAASTIRARPRNVQNGRSVRFSGRVRSMPTPPAGKLVELQVVLSGRWQTFRTTRTDTAGRWRVRYRFRRSCGLTPYRFRARLPAEAAYPFETDRTRVVRVLVRGRPCT